MTKIEWTRSADGEDGKTWNPIRAVSRSTGKRGHYCQRISPGCTFCYAATMNVWRGNGADYTVPAFDQVELYLDMDVLFHPCRWKKPRNIFPCSMTDLFADFVPDWWLRAIYGVMAMCSRHTFMTLTKRPERRRQFLTKFTTKQEWADYLSELEFDGMAVFDEDAECVIANAVNGVLAEGYNVGWPLANVWEGTSVCTQKEADELIPVTVQTPATIRWLSCEPILEHINLRLMRSGVHSTERMGLHWLVTGGESGTKARPTPVSRIRNIVEQCKEANLPVFVKQLGGNIPDDDQRIIQQEIGRSVHHAKGGNPDEWPVDLRVRQDIHVFADRMKAEAQCNPELRSPGAESVTSRT